MRCILICSFILCSWGLPGCGTDSPSSTRDGDSGTPAAGTPGAAGRNDTTDASVAGMAGTGGRDATGGAGGRDATGGVAGTPGAGGRRATGGVGGAGGSANTGGGGAGGSPHVVGKCDALAAAGGSPQLTRVPIDDPIGAEKWDLSYTTAPADMHEGGAPFGMAASRDPSVGKWVIIAGTVSSGIWKYVEP